MYIATETEPPSILEPILKQPARQMLIGGSWIGSQSGESFDVYDPSTGRVIANVPEADSADVDAAVAAAREALDGPWGATLPHVRAELMLRLADLIEENGEQIAALETLNQGKLLSVAQTVEVEMAIDYVRYMAGWATKIEGSNLRPVLPACRGRALSRVHTSRAGRGRSGDRAVELPPPHGHLEARARARDRLHRRAQARRADASDRPEARRAASRRPAFHPAW